MIFSGLRIKLNKKKFGYSQRLKIDYVNGYYEIKCINNLKFAFEAKSLEVGSPILLKRKQEVDNQKWVFPLWAVDDWSRPNYSIILKISYNNDSNTLYFKSIKPGYNMK